MKFYQLTDEQVKSVKRLWRCPEFSKKVFKLIEQYLFSLKPNSKTDFNNGGITNELNRP